MTDINSLQTNLSSNTAELEALKKSYSQAHQQLQSSLIQIQNHLQVTSTEVNAANAACERVAASSTQHFSAIDDGLRNLEDQLSVGNAENRNQMLQLQEEIARIHESLGSWSAEFHEHKRASNSVHNKLQSQVWTLEENRKRQPPQGVPPQGVPPPGVPYPGSVGVPPPGVPPPGVHVEQRAGGGSHSPRIQDPSGCHLP